MTKHIPWTEIDNFHNLRRNLIHRRDEVFQYGSKIVYLAKVKLHGTNAGVRIDPGGVVTAFSRSNIVTPQHDNCGFAAWVESRKEYFSSLVDDLPMVIYGEWCGPGIQKGVAVNGIPNKVFAVFGVRGIDNDIFISHPFVLEKMLAGIPDLHVLPYYGEFGGKIFTVPWEGTSEETEQVVSYINKCVAEVEAEDPWVKSTFGVSGVGEGLVFYPINPGYKSFKNLSFKAKGEKHAVLSKTKPAQHDPTLAANLSEFAEIVVTPARLEQAVKITCGDDSFEMRKIGGFLKWINQDILKECSAELEGSKLDKNLAVKACSTKARDWYIEQAKKV